MEDNQFFESNDNGLETWAHEFEEYMMQGEGKWSNLADTYASFGTQPHPMLIQIFGPATLQAL